MKKIKYNYSNLKQADFIELILFIIFCLTNNLNFPNLPVAAADIKLKLDAYIAALNKSAKGDHESTKLALKLRADLEKMLKRNGIYINDTADGDEIMLVSSGYDFAKQAKRSERPIVNVTSTSVAGEVKVILRLVKGAVSYLVFIIMSDEVPDPTKEKLFDRQAGTTKTYQLIEGIVPMKQYYLIFCSISKDGESEMSTPFPFMILK